jgi:hypothetical protein
VADYYATKRDLDDHRIEIAMGTGQIMFDGAGGGQKVYDDIIVPVAEYIEANGIECVLTTPGVHNRALRSVGSISSCDYLGHALWAKNVVGGPVTTEYNNVWSLVLPYGAVKLTAEDYSGDECTLLKTVNFGWKNHPHWRPHGRIGVTSTDDPAPVETLALTQRVVDDAVAMEERLSDVTSLPIHVNHHDRTLASDDGNIVGLQAERARQLLVRTGLTVLHNVTPGYSANWPEQPPANSYGNWRDGELEVSPQDMWGFVTQGLVNAGYTYDGGALYADWYKSFNILAGGWMVNPTSGPSSAVRRFIEQGGCAGVSTTGEPISNGVPNVHTFVQRILDGMSIAEASILSTPKGCFMLQPLGDPLYAPFPQRVAPGGSLGLIYI